MTLRRVAITGLGVFSAVGNTPESFFENLMAGRSGVRRITADFADLLSVRIAAETTFDASSVLSRKQLGALDRAGQMALAAAAQAWNDSGVRLTEEEMPRAGVYMGTGMGGAPTIDSVYMQLYKNNASRVSPSSIVKIMCNASASQISMQYGLRGPSLTYSTACSSSAVAIGEGFRSIKQWAVDMALAGGTESLITYCSFKCWESLGVLAQEDPDDPAASCKPFAKDRMGLVLGDGAAVIVMEEMERARRRGARIYGEIAGYGSTSDAYHITSPSIDGQERAIRMALEEARSGVDEIGYVNTHGTGTEANDVIETQAIKKVFGDRAYRFPVSSTKSMHGHLMGAAGAIEFVASILALRNQAVPPTANLKIPDPECDLDYVPLTGRDGQKVSAVMSNSFGFGGTNAVLVAKAV